MPTTKLWISEWFQAPYGRRESGGMGQGKKYIFPELKTRKIKSLNKPLAILSKKKKKRERGLKLKKIKKEALQLIPHK